MKQTNERDQPVGNVNPIFCSICTKRVNLNQKFLTCNQCNHRIHITCNDISPKEYIALCAEARTKDWICFHCNVIKSAEIVPFTLEPKEYIALCAEARTKDWICFHCNVIKSAEIVPFTLETDESLLALNNISLPSLTHLTPSLEITSQLRNLPNLSDYDIDKTLSVHINSQYYKVEDLSSLEASKNEFSIFHMNIRSLPLHCDELISLLSNVNIECKVLGLSEIKLSKGAFVRPNIDIPGYKFYYTTSNSCAGGVGIYVKSNMTVNRRDELSCCENDFESIWIEIS